MAPLLFGIKDANDVNLFKGITLQQKDHFRKSSFSYLLYNCIVATLFTYYLRR